MGARVVERLYSCLQELGINCSIDVNSTCDFGFYTSSIILDLKLRIQEEQLRQLLAALESAKEITQKDKHNNHILNTNEVVKEAYDQYSIILALQGGIV